MRASDTEITWVRVCSACGLGFRSSWSLHLLHWSRRTPASQLAQTCLQGSQVWQLRATFPLAAVRGSGCAKAESPATTAEAGICPPFFSLFWLPPMPQISMSALEDVPQRRRLLDKLASQLRYAGHSSLHHASFLYIIKALNCKPCTPAPGATILTLLLDQFRKMNGSANASNGAEPAWLKGSPAPVTSRTCRRAFCQPVA